MPALGMEACLNGTELVTPPRAPVTTITLEFRADPEDLASAAALGWANGIPGVAVTLAPEDSASGAPQQLQGSDSGTMILDSVAGGRYVVDAVRWLTDEERAQLPAADDAVGFVARVPLNTASAQAQVPVQMAASRRHGLVISEWAFNISRRFDRASFDGRGYNENVEYYYSVSRRSIPVPAGNQMLLQLSRNSDADFIRTLRSPGIVP